MKAVYPYLKTYSDELKWSIKSLKNTDVDGVIVVGDTDLDVPKILPESNQWAVYSRYSDSMNRILSADVDGDFLLMNDDFFILDKWTPEVYNKGSLVSHLSTLAPSAYTASLRRTLDFLTKKGLPTLSYETHTPMVMNKQKLLDLWEIVKGDYFAGTPHSIRSLYGNYYKIPSETIQDVKNPTNFANKTLISTSEQTFNGELGEYIMSVISGVKPPLRKEYSVSVIIPAYNAQDTILECLNSIPKHKRIKEVIVCDDGSTDKTAEILKAYKGIKTITNKVNKGVGYSFNRLLDEYTGDFLLRLDSDDMLLPDITKVLDRINGEDIIYFNMVDTDGTIRPLNPQTKGLTVANCHLYRREFIGETRTIETNWSEDRYLWRELQKKSPTELFTDINAYNYNYPRKGSLTDIKLNTGKPQQILDLRLNLFTNCYNEVAERKTIKQTYDSYCATFGIPEKVTIYCDPNPNPNLYLGYEAYLQRTFPQATLIKTTGLADGWVKSVNNADTPYIFQCEADWTFQNIDHSLSYIINTMKQDGLWFMLFNQHKNVHDPRLAQWQSYLRPHNGIYSKTDRISNNPHIIDVSQYKIKAVPLVDWAVPGAGYIEQALEKKFDIAVYGKYGLSPTIVHMDMRKGGLK